MTIQQMKNYIHELYPKWNLDKFDDSRIIAIYYKELKRRTKKK